MSFIDDISNKIKNGDVERAIGKFGNAVGDGLNTTINELKGNNIPEKTIPSSYSAFPKYNGTIDNVDVSVGSKTKKCVIKYNEYTKEDINKYIEVVKYNGFKEENENTYIKDNNKIIIRDENNILEITFEVTYIL